jgi:outer membrane protein TolC
LLTVAWISAAVPAAAEAPTADQQAPPPRVDDPMLVPPTPALREVRSWDEAISLLRSRSPSYLSGNDQVLRADAQVGVVIAQVLPTLDGQGSYTHQFLTQTLAFGPARVVVPPPNVWAAGATLGWNFADPRALYGIGTAKQNVVATKQSFENQRRQLAQGAVTALLEELGAARVADLNRVGLREALELEVLTRTRYAYSQGTELDIDRAMQNVASARADVVRGDENLKQAREQLGQLLGIDTPLGTVGTLDLDQFDRAVARTCRLNDFIERRPDVMAARTSVEIARRNVHDVELRFAPSAGVASALNYATQTTFGPKTTWSVQAVVNVPIFEGGGRIAALRDAHAAADQAEQALIATRLAALVESARADRLVGVSASLRDTAKNQRDLAESIDRRTHEAYVHGFGSSLDLVISARALRDAEINLVVRELQVAEARANAVLVNAECFY